jgi:hypothetical protein
MGLKEPRILKLIYEKYLPSDKEWSLRKDGRAEGEEKGSFGCLYSSLPLF